MRNHGDNVLVRLIEKLKISIHFAQRIAQNRRLQGSGFIYILRKISPDCATKSRSADNIGTGQLLHS
ncbi:hypothetical protein CO662_35165 [Rhizobium anhuiense]|uniref:Uncharacterized protein n=1 Tax=Rhizobium anhuiense TaxID=1184720 RepID=A0ABX4IWT1_9HYPH|nr:hypothetical protein CO668_15655 [Rhizobium anhuiense]PDS47385.1 hypothetical protein CO662_35165 [Rhizobium anhuiense]